MFKNLQIEMIRFGIKHKDIAATLFLSQSSLSKKMKNEGKHHFMVEEMIAIKKIFKGRFSLDYLFSEETYDHLKLN
jgi:hypothetical protein